MTRVNRLMQGDKLLVKPLPSSLAKGDWIMLLATISPSGHQINTARFDLSDAQAEPVIEIKANDLTPVILIAPQVRNMFGLYTSFRESADLLKAAVESDPQLFYQLQKLDQVNQAVAVLREQLALLIQKMSPTEAIEATQAVAAKFGVKKIDSDCFKNSQTDTQCVALDMIRNRDFVIPSVGDLSSLIGQQKAEDLTGYLTSSLHIISVANDFLTNKFRDQYDFAPSFGRIRESTRQLELYSLTRFRNGDIKTVYVYTPAWFAGEIPHIKWEDSTPICLFRWGFKAKTIGRLPLVNYWHDWNMSVVSASSHEMIAKTGDLSFNPANGMLKLGAEAQKALSGIRESTAEVYLTARFGFTRLDWPAMKVVLPQRSWTEQDLIGLKHLVSAESADLVMNSSSSAACVDEVALQTDGQPWMPAVATDLGAWHLDLSKIPPGDGKLRITQAGQNSELMQVHIQKPRALVESIEHANLDDHLVVVGQRLDRIEKLTWADVTCQPLSYDARRMVLACDHDIRLNQNLPDQVQVLHWEHEPAPLTFRLKKTRAIPQVEISRTSPNAVLIQPSAAALQWGLGPYDRFMSQDSGLSFLFQARQGYVFSQSGYRLELKFENDVATDHKPLSVRLISNPSRNELRTREPVYFNSTVLPSTVNALLWRVVDEATGLFSEWQPVNRSVLLLPDLQSLSCAEDGEGFWLHGRHLELIDQAGFERSQSAEQTPAESGPPTLATCSDGLCMRIAGPANSNYLNVELHWVVQQQFRVKMPSIPICQQ
jgi:hypothetical protein